MPHFLGMDGGGTRTTAWLANRQGRVLARSEAGPSNPLKVGLAASQREILRAARTAMRQGRAQRLALDAVCVGAAGVGGPPVPRFCTLLTDAAPTPCSKRKYAGRSACGTSPR